MKKRLLQYFLGDESLTEEDIRALEEQIARDPRWLLMHGSEDGLPSRPDWNTEHELEKAHERLGLPTASPSRQRVDRGPEQNRRTPRAPSSPRLRSALAAMVLFAVAIAGALWIAGPFTEVELVREYTADRGKRIHLTLDDGSQVILNAESRMLISSDFGADDRHVRLTGEAYFDVKHDPERPFIISAGDATVRVLGTAFGVRTYETDDDVRVVVREGRVSLSSAEPAIHAVVELTAGKAGSLTRTGEIVLERDIDLIQALGWIDGRLVFSDTPLGDVARELERWYDITIEIRDERLLELPLTAQFEGQAVAHVIDVVARTMDLSYEIDERHVTFAPSHP